MPKFTARVQYGDYRGTSAADEADVGALYKRLISDGLIGENDFILGITMFSGENSPGHVHGPFVRILTVRAATHDQAKQYALDDPIRVREIEPAWTFEEFFGLFKRFSLALSLDTININDREYESEAD